MKSKMMKMLVAALALASFGLMGCDTTVKDADGNSYPTVKIGNQVWMAKNLNVNVPGSMCYDNDPANCEKYGRLYTWEAAMKACPEGWHLPSKEEFDTFLEMVELRTVQIVAQKKLNAEPLKKGEDKFYNHLRVSSWENGFDSFGFSALPAGKYDSDFKKFVFLGDYADFWSSTEYNSINAYSLDFCDLVGAIIFINDKYNGYSVRCLQDSNEGGEASSQRSEAQPPSGTLKDSRDGKTYKTVKIGNQTWMAENLNYKTGESKCYDNKESNCKKYGRLYTWNDAKKACPNGWHLPSEEELESFLSTVGTSEAERSLNLRAGSWKNGKDKYGFSALPAGSYNSDGKKFHDLGLSTFFWSSTESIIGAYPLYFNDGHAYVIIDDEYSGFSVRCLQD